MRIRVIATALSAVVLAAVPVFTITNGQPDGNAHPYVGLAFQPIPNSQFVTICSGSALSPTKFLTAAHCFDPTMPAFVSFKSGPPFGATFVAATFHPDPAWCLGCGPGLPGFDTHDVAVMTLSTAVTLSRYASLPEPGIVDTLPMKTAVDVVGYGVQEIIRGGGRPQPFTSLIRFFAPAQIIQSNNIQSTEFLKLTANPAQGKGGICSGDSGGPDLLGGTDTVLAVNSYGTNGNCAGVTYSQRVDLPDILQFIASVQ
jgi:trypsin